MRLAFFLLLAAPAIALALVACTVTANVGELSPLLPDSASQEESGSPSSSNDDGGIAEGSISQDPDSGSPAIESDAGCGVSFSQRGNFIDVQVITGPTPYPNGGIIVPGMYELISMRSFYPGDTGTMQVRETMRVRGSSSAGAFDILTEARNATGDFKGYALHGETKTFTVGGSTPAILTKLECPQKAQFDVQGRFESKNDTLLLFDDENAIERVYRRVP